MTRRWSPVAMSAWAPGFEGGGSERGASRAKVGWPGVAMVTLDGQGCLLEPRGSLVAVGPEASGSVETLAGDDDPNWAAGSSSRLGGGVLGSQLARWRSVCGTA